jgi:hypothetical protein
LAHDFYVPSDKLYLVDAGYANTPSFTAPCRNVRYHLHEQSKSNQRPSNAKELFNLRHAQLCNHVGRIIVLQSLLYIDSDSHHCSIPYNGMLVLLEENQSMDFTHKVCKG